MCVYVYISKSSLALGRVVSRERVNGLMIGVDGKSINRVLILYPCKDCFKFLNVI